jgi:hypothetical protein
VVVSAAGRVYAEQHEELLHDGVTGPGGRRQKRLSRRQDSTVECRLLQIGLGKTHRCGCIVPPPLATPQALHEPLTATPRWHGPRNLCELGRMARLTVRTTRQGHARPADPVDECRLDAVAGHDCGGVPVEKRLKLGKQPRHRIGVDRNVQSAGATRFGAAGLQGGERQVAQQREQAPPRRRPPHRGGVANGARPIAAAHLSTPRRA